MKLDGDLALGVFLILSTLLVILGNAEGYDDFTDVIKKIILLTTMIKFSLDDIRTREVRDELVYMAFWTGIVVSLKEGLQLAHSLFVTLLVGLILHISGVFALGDLWAGLIISSWWPATLYGVPVSVISLIGGMVAGAVYGIISVIRRTFKEWLNGLFHVVALSFPFAFGPEAGITSLILLRLGLPKELLFLLIWPVLQNNRVFQFIYIAVTFTLLYTLSWVLKTSGRYLVREKEPEEGDIPAEVIDVSGNAYTLSLSTIIKISRGELKPAHSLRADGLTPEDVENLMRMGVKKIKVKDAVPLFPFITLALVVLEVFL